MNHEHKQPPVAGFSTFWGLWWFIYYIIYTVSYPFTVQQDACLWMNALHVSMQYKHCNFVQNKLTTHKHPCYQKCHRCTYAYMIVEADACVCKCGRPRCFSKLLTAPDTFWPIGLTYTGKCQKNDPSYMNVSNELPKGGPGEYSTKFLCLHWNFGSSIWLANLAIHYFMNLYWSSLLQTT